MPRITVLRGLPASGKSTYAESLLQKTGNTVRLNKDLLRKMLHFDKWSGQNEGLTKAVEKELAYYLLTNTKRSIVIDDTNLKPDDEAMWREVANATGSTIKFVQIKTPVSDCIERDMDRPDPVGKSVIIKMALSSGYEMSDLFKFKDTVVVDIDGTLADITHRLKHVKKEPKDWKKFFGALSKDLPRNEVIETVNTLALYNNIVIVTGRPEDYQEATTEWLCDNDVWYDLLLMRPSGDKRPDYEVKKSLYDKYLSKLNVKLVIDDRPSVIRMWKENGLTVMDVGKGVEF